MHTIDQEARDHMRRRLLADVHDTAVGDKAESRDELVQTEWVPEFETYMRNRLLMGRYRYGRFDDPAKGLYKNVESALKRLQKYQATGNQEHLVDAANLLMVEYAHPSHPCAHFEASDDGEHTEAL